MLMKRCCASHMPLWQVREVNFHKIKIAVHVGVDVGDKLKGGPVVNFDLL
jgi:hypothetical protein